MRPLYAWDPAPKKKKKNIQTFGIRTALGKMLPVQRPFYATAFIFTFFSDAFCVTDYQKQLSF